MNDTQSVRYWVGALEVVRVVQSRTPWGLRSVHSRAPWILSALFGYVRSILIRAGGHSGPFGLFPVLVSGVGVRTPSG